MLKPKGKLILKTGVLENLELFKNWKYNQDPTHVCFYTPATFTWIKNKFDFSEFQREGDFIYFKK